MTEKLTCPFCARAIDLDMVETADLWKDRERLAARLGPAWRLANEYIDAFRAHPEHRITLKRRVRHLMPIAHLWETKEFEFNGKRYRVTEPVIRDALTRVCETGKFGFKDHNYLKVILVKGAERISAQGLTAAEERKRDEARRQKGLEAWRLGGQEPDKEHPSFLASQSPSDEEPMSTREFQKRIGELANKIGGRHEG